MKRPFAVFDIDGTLSRVSLYNAVVEHLIDNHTLTGVAYERIKDTYDEWRKRVHEGSYAAYEIAIVNAWSELQSEIKYSDFISASEEVFESHKHYNYTYTRRLIRELKKQGYFLVALSGSHQETIDLIADYYGFDFAIGSTYSTKDNVYTGEGSVPALAKGTALKKIVEEHNLDLADSIAVGDTAGDIPMLEMVKMPIAFNPDIILKNKAIEEKWQIVIERKNSTYSLIPDTDGYRLEI